MDDSTEKITKEGIVKTIEEMTVAELKELIEEAEKRLLKKKETNG